MAYTDGPASPSGIFKYWKHEKCGREFGQKKAEEPVCPYPSCQLQQNIRRFNGRRFVNAQVGEKEATAVAIHPETGEVVYCFGDDPSKPVPDEWSKLGFEKKQFTSFQELQKFCRATGQINDVEGDWHKDDGYFEEYLDKRNKAEKEQREQYMEERHKVLQAHPELRGRR